MRRECRHGLNACRKICNSKTRAKEARSWFAERSVSLFLILPSIQGVFLALKSVPGAPKLIMVTSVRVPGSHVAGATSTIIAPSRSIKASLVWRQRLTGTNTVGIVRHKLTPPPCLWALSKNRHLEQYRSSDRADGRQSATNHALNFS